MSEWNHEVKFLEHTHTQTHPVTLLVTGLEFLEKYCRWNSHALGILSSHFLALHKRGQLSSLCSCWATNGLRASGEVKPARLPVRTLHSLFILLLRAGNCERPSIVLAQGLRAESVTSLNHWVITAHDTERDFGCCFQYYKSCICLYSRDYALLNIQSLQ